MDRETRKANLKKLQLPCATGYKQGKKHQRKNVTPKSTTISNYFLTPEKSNNHTENVTNGVKKTFPTVSDHKQNKTSHSTDNIKPGYCTRAKRTKLDAFLFKDSNGVPNSTKTVRKSLKDDDLILPTKRIRKAPKLNNVNLTKSSGGGKRQTTIKSAFLRNEELFAEIVAQHSAADQFDADDVQLALAISKSDAECKGVTLIEDNEVGNEDNSIDGDTKAEIIREKLKKYGFRTAENKDYKAFTAAFLPKSYNRKVKSKWANKFTALTLRSTENQSRKLQANIEKLLGSRLCIQPQNDNEKCTHHYKLHSSLLKKLEGQQNKRVLQIAQHTNQSNEMFFVNELFEINRLPAGHLLKKWADIPGRDLSPKQKNKQSIESLKLLENAYQNLEQFLYSHKTLDFTVHGSKKEGISDHKKLPTNSEEIVQKVNATSKSNVLNSFKFSKKDENNAHNKVVEPKEILQRNEPFDNENNERSLSTSPCDNKILQLLPSNNFLGRMEVSSCSTNSQGAINASQKNRSNSPDIFADSDDEIKEEKAGQNNNTEELCPPSNVQFIDLTQDDDLRQSVIKISNENFSQSKTIEEIDLFAESLQEDNLSRTLENKKENFNFSLNKTTNYKNREIIEKEMRGSINFLPRTTFQQHGEDTVLRELALDQNDTSVLNSPDFQESQASLCDKMSPAKDNTLSDNTTDCDATFRALCKKYLNTEAINRSGQGDLIKDNSQTTETTHNFDNFTNFNMDFDISVARNFATKRKWGSFSHETPLKNNIYYCDANLSKCKSQTLNKYQSDASIDLTQDDAEDDENQIDDEELILSDDEINYSIFQANKSLHIKGCDIVSALDSESSSDEGNIIEFPKQNNENKQFSFLDLKDKEDSLIKIILEPEESISDFGITTPKYSASNSLTQDEEKFDRNEFGVLEEYPEIIDYIENLCTPTKVLNDASFLSSPTETTAPMKQFSKCSRSSQKFQELINNIETKSPPHSSLNDFDEFDRLVSISPLKSVNTNKKAQGIDQLLTAEIRFKENPAFTEVKEYLATKSDTEEVEFNNKIYTVRYTVSPKPDYSKYTDDQLLKELYNFGIKPLKRKQGIKMLEYIYNQTHPIIIENDTNDLDRPCTSKDALKTQTITKTVLDNFTNTSSTACEPVGDNNISVISSSKLNLKDSCGREMLRYAADLKPELTDEIYIMQTNITKKTAQPLLPFHIAWYNLVCSNQKLHEKILMYEPIDLQEVFSFFKSLGYRYDPKDLKCFFDRRCIIFRYDLPGSSGKLTESNRHVRKSKKTKIPKNNCY